MTKAVFTTKFQTREFIEQAWFITSVTLMPTILVSIPFGAVISLQVGNLTGQLGAQSFAGASAVLAVVREAAPIAAAMIIAGAAGSAICSDMGARKIREEIDAMEVLGIDPIERLVVPRVLATVFVALMINGIVIATGIGGGYFFTVIVQGGNAGAFLSSFTALASLPDLYISMVKAVLFGYMAAIVGAYKGLNAGGGPSGVGPRGQRGRDHRLHGPVRAQLDHHGDLLPGRPAGRVVAMATITDIGREFVRERRIGHRAARRPAALLRQGAGLDADRASSATGARSGTPWPRSRSASAGSRSSPARSA